MDLEVFATIWMCVVPQLVPFDLGSLGSTGLLRRAHFLIALLLLRILLHLLLGLPRAPNRGPQPIEQTILAT
jgi:hypothetical protein